jgi:catechol 2,3-dioxygenase-like lactoylglutathione lyase family enzyme
MSLARKHFLLILTFLLFVIPELTTRAEDQAKDSSKPAILGNGQGVDHIGIVVRDLETAKKTYRNLGFTVFAGGIEQLPAASPEWRNSPIYLEIGILELLTALDRTKTFGGMLAKFVEKHEGALFLGLEVSPVDEAAKFLRSRGYNVQGPKPGSMNDDPEQTDKSPSWGSWRLAGFETGPIPAAHLPSKSTDAIFFVQYDPSVITIHANTAKKLSSVWMAVKDLQASLREYKSMGLPNSRKLAVPQLGAQGQEIEAGQGTILLLQPEKLDGKVASFLAERGAEGIMGVSLEVASLKTARSLLEANTKRQFAPYPGPFGKSILIPPEFTHGVWIEFFQK